MPCISSSTIYHVRAHADEEDLWDIDPLHVRHFRLATVAIRHIGVPLAVLHSARFVVVAWLKQQRREELLLDVQAT